MLFALARQLGLLDYGNRYVLALQLVVLATMLCFAALVCGGAKEDKRTEKEPGKVSRASKRAGPSKRQPPQKPATKAPSKTQSSAMSAVADPKGKKDPQKPPKNAPSNTNNASKSKMIPVDKKSEETKKPEPAKAEAKKDAKTSSMEQKKKDGPATGAPADPQAKPQSDPFKEAGENQEPPIDYEQKAADEGLVIQPKLRKFVGNIDEMMKANQEQFEKDIQEMKNEPMKAPPVKEDKKILKVSINEKKCVLFESADIQTEDNEEEEGGPGV